jgi:hypothetical protein
VTVLVVIDDSAVRRMLALVDVASIGRVVGIGGQGWDAVTGHQSSLE